MAEDVDVVGDVDRWNTVLDDFRAFAAEMNATFDEHIYPNKKRYVTVTKWFRPNGKEQQSAHRSLSKNR